MADASEGLYSSSSLQLIIFFSFILTVSGALKRQVSYEADDHDLFVLRY